jgi:mycothiol synthase
MNVKFPGSQLLDEKQIEMMRKLVAIAPGEIDPVDFNEMLALPEIRPRVRLWLLGPEKLAAFCFVDLYDNLIYAVGPEIDLHEIGPEIIRWGEIQASQIASETGELPKLDAVCRAEKQEELAFLMQSGFVEQTVRTLIYARSLEGRLFQPVLPSGFHLRSVRGEEEAQALAELHRASFGSDYMTTEYRIAMMRTPVYDRSMDLVIETDAGNLVAFCVCSLEENEGKIGSPDPIGVRPGFTRRGLGKSILLAGLRLLQEKGAKQARLGTSSENIPMQKLAESVEFSQVSEKMWLRKEIPME